MKTFLLRSFKCFLMVSFTSFDARRSRGSRGLDAKMLKIYKNRKIKNLSLFTYSLLVVVRIVLVFIPQYGYIHPDEFFQTSELISGEFFGKLEIVNGKFYSY